MCLYSAQKIEQKGEITCYKVLMVRVEMDGKHYFSPYQLTEWKIGRVYTDRFISNEDSKFMVNGFGEINSGAYHTFQKKGDATQFLKYIWKPNILRMCDGLCVAKCVIPEENAYLYDGFTFLGKLCPEYLDSYASEKLKVVEIVKEVMI